MGYLGRSQSLTGPKCSSKQSCLRSTTGSASRRWSIAWSRSLRRSLIRAALGIARVARPPMPWPKSGAKGRFKLTRDRIKSKLNRQNLYAIPTQKSVDRFKDQIRALTMRRIPLRLGELIETINPIIRGRGNYYCRSHVRKRFHQLDGWIIRRLWSHRGKRWRNAAWKECPTARLRTEFKLVGLVSLIPSLQAARARS